MPHSPKPFKSFLDAANSIDALVQEFVEGPSDEPLSVKKFLQLILAFRRRLDDTADEEAKKKRSKHR